ncbi:AT-hook motif nuclear-localized protein 14 isoform X2 [Malania oleifera]|uniref:AT-hook motif nuclear-localized protein 14 isoform X2 n=1 Tax=Malania oleifera TaxID=397392 RepID=UPI0025AEB90C|nr:AT-hook motif nuclear-localized protein 14 isoform X2 [Malania oleifera]
MVSNPTPPRTLTLPPPLRSPARGREGGPGSMEPPSRVGRKRRRLLLLPLPFTCRRFRPRGGTNRSVLPLAVLFRLPAGLQRNLSFLRSVGVACNAGQGFTPHIINVSAGEDVAQKIMFFMQQSKRELCILSASGSISNASLRQPAMSGGNVTIEGRFEILSLSGSYVRTELGGRTGGLSVCLSTTDGQVLGGGVGGPLKAAGPVQVIVGTFLIDAKTDVSAGVKGDASLSKLPSQFGGVSVSSADFQPVVEHTGRNPIRGNDDDQSIGGSHFMVEPHGMQMSHSHPTSWTGGIDGRSSAPYEFTGRTAHGSQESPENGDYERLPD